MVLAFLLAQLLPWARGLKHGAEGTPEVALRVAGGEAGSQAAAGPSGSAQPAPPGRSAAPGGWLLVLGSANVDECLRGMGEPVSASRRVLVGLARTGER
jgi:hypothetical protein